ncbi:B12 binding domain-containing protein [Streptomyces sp. DconLS]|uniref:MerR family transcriptional regulator n=1 Tax=Streptomyces sp. LamerLS-31b TaxID=1839765 RepID=UPI00081E7EB4|nr:MULTISPECIES: cobalamin B12-binding domain-containing protein [unclassified Streptomyces]SCF79042.1 B12 binding domain-containing protein [Streptomyces sp. DconLS]SCF84104.1 B12 binding domain-containing protein [Streptomyces sp. LamerLS-31b]
MNSSVPPPAAAPAVPGDAGLTTGVLARRLGVSPMTLRSWDRRYGIGPTARTGGGHRRWTAADVATVEEMCRLTATGVPPADAARTVLGTAARPLLAAADAAAPAPAPPTGRSRAAGALPLGDVRQECRGLARAAVRLDAPALEKQLTAAVERHGVVAAWHEVMVPTLHAVGRRWASSGDRYVEVEHLLSWHVSTVLRRCAPPAADPVSPATGCVLLACVPGEQHTLPLEALHAALGRAGLPARMLGAAVPAEALDAAVRRLGPVAVVLWAQESARAAPALARDIAATRWGMKGARRGPAVLVGGPGWSPSQPAGVLRPAGLAQAVEALRTLCTAG